MNCCCKVSMSVEYHLWKCLLLIHVPFFSWPLDSLILFLCCKCQISGAVAPVLGVRVKTLLFLEVLLLVCPKFTLALCSFIMQDNNFHPQPHRFFSKFPVPQTDSSACCCGLHTSFPGLRFYIWLYWAVFLLIFVHNLPNHPMYFVLLVQSSLVNIPPLSILYQWWFYVWFFFSLVVDRNMKQQRTGP